MDQNNPRTWEGTYTNSSRDGAIITAMLNHSPMMRLMVDDVTSEMIEDLHVAYPFAGQFIKIHDTWRFSDSSMFLMKFYFSIRNGWLVNLNQVGCLDLENRRAFTAMLEAWRKSLS